MKLSEINDWFTLVANIGVICGLIFLGLEMRQSSRLVERELSISQSDNVHGQIVESGFLTGILVKISDVQGVIHIVVDYADVYGMSEEEAHRWWRYILQTWNYNQAEWIYRGRPNQDCSVYVLTFLDHQIFYKHMKDLLDPGFVECIDSKYVEPSDNGT